MLTRDKRGQVCARPLPCRERSRLRPSRAPTRVAAPSRRAMSRVSRSIAAQSSEGGGWAKGVLRTLSQKWACARGNHQIISMSALGHFRQIGAVATLRGCPLRPESGHWELSTLARSSRGPPISHWDGFLASLRLGPHACDCCTLESALGLTECERSVQAVDLRDRLRGGRQPLPRRVSL